jgi:hypothetical protein
VKSGKGKGSRIRGVEGSSEKGGKYRVLGFRGKTPKGTFVQRFHNLAVITNNPSRKTTFIFGGDAKE